jgi:DTW domain-containing protein
MLRLSPSLAALPKVSFEPPGLSRFEIRKQPARECLSTLEAIHHVIELLGPDCGFDVEGRAHDHMLELFDRMVDRQIDYQNRLGSRPRFRGENATRS